MIDEQKHASNPNLNPEKDLLSNVNWNPASRWWLGGLILAFLVCIYFYYLQLRDGLAVTGLTDYVSWGIYISNFVFFVATSLVGMLITSVLGMIGIKWVKPISRIAEIVAVAFAMVAGLVIITYMGRPDRLLNLYTHSRLQSPIVWDITIVITYVVMSLFLLYIPLIPDLDLASKNATWLPRIQRRIYKALSLGWAQRPEQYALIKKYLRILLVLIIPVALAIHTVTSWLFAMTLRTGWDSSIMGPYFVSGAFVAGCAAVIITMYIFRRNFHLEKYITQLHFDNMGKLLVLVSLVYLYFNINEILVPAYKFKVAEKSHIEDIISGHESLLYWMVQFGGLIVPFLLLMIKRFRRPLSITLISSVILLGAWFKRYLIVVPTQLEPFLPIQNVPESWQHYSPTLAEIAITAASFILVVIIISVLAKTVPVVPIWEIKEDNDEKKK